MKAVNLIHLFFVQQFKTVRKTLSASSEGAVLIAAAELGGEHFSLKNRKTLNILVAELVRFTGTQ